MSYYKKVLLLSLVILITGCSSKNPTRVSSNSYSYPDKLPATMKPYTIKGKTYYPETVALGDTQKGIASWYGPGFHGKKTSNGETYSMYSQTAAHKTFPMNTMVKVTNLRNHKSTIVRINDRGPFVDDRVIDLSKKVALQLGVHEGGTAPVKLEVVGVDKKYNVSNSTLLAMQQKKTPVAPKISSEPKNLPSTDYNKQDYNNQTISDYSDYNEDDRIEADNLDNNKVNNEIEAIRVASKDVPDYTSKYKKINEEQKQAKSLVAYNNFYVQIGSFENPQKAYNLKNSHNLSGHDIIVKNIDGKYKALVAGFNTKEEAREFARNGQFNGAFVTNKI